jgi:hypothetical protein
MKLEFFFKDFGKKNGQKNMTKLIGAFAILRMGLTLSLQEQKNGKIRQPVINYKDMVSPDGRVPAVYHTVL